MKLIFGAVIGFIIGAGLQELVHETGRCSRRSTRCPCEVRAAKEAWEQAEAIMDKGPDPLPGID